MCADETSEALFTAVRHQAEAEKQEIFAKARQEADCLQAQADAEIARLKAEAVSRANKELLLETDRLLGRARMDKGLSLLRAKRGLLQEAFEQARREIQALPHGDGYQGTLQALIAEAIEIAGDNAELTIAKSEKDLCKTAVAEMGFSCSLKPSDHPPGTVIATSGDGHRRIDNSLYTRLRTAEMLRRHEIAALLFGRRDHQGDAK